MKIPEFKTTLKSEKRPEVLSAIALEVYRNIPLRGREELDIAIKEIIQNGGKKPNPKQAMFDSNALLNAARNFADNAWAGLYFEPNNIVRKKKRSLWRFEAKHYVKGLTEHDFGEREDEAADVLISIYRILAKGCRYWLFPSEHPFHALGIYQSKLYVMLLKKVFRNGYSADRIREMIMCATTDGISSDDVRFDLLKALIAALPTTDTKETTVKIITEIVAKYEPKIKKFNDISYTDLSQNPIFITNQCSTLYLMIKITLGEWEDGVKFCIKHVRKPNRYYKVKNIEFATRLINDVSIAFADEASKKAILDYLEQKNLKAPTALI